MKFAGSIGGSPLAGLILDTSARNWHVLTAYSGLVQFLGVLCIIYGESALVLVLDCYSDAPLARVSKERRVFAKI
ncbi:hypothetical protein AG1IA_04883 [Rhizoctonia solani AG-1 IA]|uniref:MFS_1 domain-containing protein n=1 Tax=Thanatephorus cucumeris (strain AG1-IA) TaxID=983506 RepID=L8WW81_THACA|nr:hypothetical protein AG1IA_04883 [Rhizoctonia solani AG-1 IA]